MSSERPRPERVVWSLDATLDPDAARQYREQVAGLFDITLGGPDAEFYNHLDGYDVGGLVFGCCRGRSQRFLRTPGHARRDGFDTYQLILSLSGHWRGDYDGRQVAGDAGSIRLVDMARPFDVESDDFETLNLMLPREAMSFAARQDLHGVVIVGDGVGPRLLRSFLTTVWEAMPKLTRAEAEAICMALPGLIFGALPGAGPAPEVETSLGRTYLALARIHIDDHLSDPGLTPETLRQKLGVSRAYLYGLFEPSGGVSAYIQARRLDRAFDEIVRTSKTQASLAQIAYRNGFRSDAHFSRAFLSRFHLRPSALRDLGVKTEAPSATDAGVERVLTWVHRLG